MNCEIIIKDRAIVEYETPEFKDEKMEMTFKEFKAEFLIFSFLEQIQIMKLKYETTTGPMLKPRILRKLFLNMQRNLTGSQRTEK